MHVMPAGWKSLQTVCRSLVGLSWRWTPLSLVRGDESARPGAAATPGVVLVVACRKKERTYPELARPRSRVAGEVGGRWSEETPWPLRLLARAQARSEPLNLRKRAEQAWRMRWAATLACSAACAFAASLIGLRVGPLTHEVVNDHRHEGLV